MNNQLSYFRTRVSDLLQELQDVESNLTRGGKRLEEDWANASNEIEPELEFLKDDISEDDNQSTYRSEIVVRMPPLISNSADKTRSCSTETGHPSPPWRKPRNKPTSKDSYRSLTKIWQRINLYD